MTEPVVLPAFLAEAMFLKLHLLMDIFHAMDVNQDGVLSAEEYLHTRTAAAAHAAARATAAGGGGGGTPQRREAAAGVGQLVEMGFGAAQAEEALESVGGDVEAAIALLCSAG